MEAYAVRYESAAHFDHPRELVFAAAHALLGRDGARLVADEPPAHLRAERDGAFDEMWFEAWGEGTGIRYKGGRSLPLGPLGELLLGPLARRAAEARAHEVFDALRAALGD